jgi:hypothetical protein
MQHNFYEIAFKAIYEYKKIIKKRLSADLYREKIATLRLDKNYLSSQTAVELFYIFQAIVRDLMKSRGQLTKDCQSYCGISAFIKHYKKVLSEYHVDNGNLIHLERSLLKSLVASAQLLNRAIHPSLNNHKYQELTNCINIVLKHGQVQHIDFMIKALSRDCAPSIPGLPLLISRLERQKTVKMGS